MEEGENRKGPGVFYAVIGVATLVVAIIGATFAYFSVTVSNAPEDNITGTTGEGTKDAFSLDVEKVSNGTGNLIPLAQNLMPNALTASRQCVDDNGNTVCQVYKITATNNSTGNALRVAGKLVLTSDAPNMKWELLATQTSQVASPVVRSVGQDIAGSVETNKLLDANGGKGEYYVIVWLDETNKPQDADEANAETGATAEANKAFTGIVTFSALDANGQPTTGLTATFSS